ncbi:MAG TPA: sigma-70 family RNA polymerase sigma factor [Marmoricola sp.]|nr:sigma-70 family RNA polymerase sigma factor [Marmoricola sp.]
MTTTPTEPISQDRGADEEPSAVARERQHRSTQANELLVAASSASDRAERRRLVDAAVLLQMPLARGLARAHAGKGIALEDLEQVACLALIRAAHRFDPGKHTDFLAYAVPTIRGELKKHFRDHGWTVRPPRHLQELQPRANAARTDLRQRLGREPSVAEIARAVGDEPSAVREALGATGCFQPHSLDRPIAAESSETVLDLMPGDDDESAHEAVEARVILAPVVRRLKERDRRILHLRFVGNCTQQQIAEEIGVTQMQVSRLLNRILRDLRRELT